MLRQRIAFAALIVGLGMLFYSFVPGYGPQQTWFQDADAILSDSNVPITAVNWHPHTDTSATTAKPLQFKTGTADNTVAVDLVGLKPGWYTLELVHKNATTNTDWIEYKELQVLDKRLGIMAAVGALLAILAAPEVLVRKSRLVWKSGKRQVCATGWTYLLMEPGSGLSLARLQLIILFVPAAAVYLALSFPLHVFPSMPDTVWQLLGLGGATAALSTIITPAKSAAPALQPESGAPAADATAAGADPATTGAAPSTEDMVNALAASLAQQGAAALDVNSAAGPAALKDAIRQALGALTKTAPVAMSSTETIAVRAPSAGDLFEEVNGYGDISRYQSLVMCVATAVTFFVSFFDTWSVPELPPKVLELLGTSLAVYLGVKGINQVKKSNAEKATTTTPQ